MTGTHPLQGKPSGFERLLRFLFPERQVHLRTEGRVNFFRFSRLTQMVVVALFLLGGMWTVFTSVSYVLHDRILVIKDDQIASARLAYQSLLGEVATYQNKFTDITRDLEKNHGLMLSLVERNAALQQNLRSVENQLDTTEQERRKIVSAREKLKNQLSDIEDNLRQLASRNFSLKDNLDTVEIDLQTALAERNHALFKGGRMQRQIDELEIRLVDIQESEREAVQRLTNSALAYIVTMQKVIELTGLKVDRLLAANNNQEKGLGGPFIAAKPDDLPAGQLKADLINLEAHLQRSEGLQGLMRKLPLSSPLKNFRISSGYGKRRDPINKKWAAHYGLDLVGVFKTSVYVTAPGVVTYVGWKGKYGKLVEVDHGMGLKTRFGHLNKILVKKGQRLKFRDKVGLLGNTGRSTGPHLHYEIVFKNKTLDPAKFIKAGRYVFQE